MIPTTEAEMQRWIANRSLSFFVWSSVPFRLISAGGAYYLGRYRKESGAAWAVGAFFLPRLVPALGIISTLK